MVNIFHTVLNMSITGAYIAAAIIVLRLAMKKLPKRYSYALWIILGIRLLCPFSFSSAASLFNMIKPDVSENQMMYIPENIEYAPRVTLPPADSAVNDSLDSLAPQPNNSANPMQIVSAVCTLAWLLGFAAMALYTVISYVLVRKKVKNALYLQQNIFVCKDIDSPFVYGITNPRIYLPENIPATETEFILAHERAHIRRGDHIVKLIAMAALCIHWFNPMAWVSYKLMIRDMELSCDEIAVTGFDRDVRKDYAETLLNMSMRQNKIVLGGILAFGESSIKTRIKSVLRAKKPKVIVTVAAVCVVAVSSVCLLTNASVKLVNSNVVSAEIAQVTELVSYGGDTSVTLTDGKAAAKLINSLSVKELNGLPDFEGTDISAYTLTLHYDDDHGKYSMVSIISPVFATEAELNKDNSLFFMTVENEKDAKAYSLPRDDYMKLAEFMTEPFEMFPEGVYVNSLNENLSIVVSKDGDEKIFTYIENGNVYNLGAAERYAACGTMALWEEHVPVGSFLTGKEMRYLGNNMISYLFSAVSSSSPPNGVFVKSNALGTKVSDEIYGVTPVPGGYEAHSVDLYNSNCGVFFSLPEGWTVKIPEAGEQTLAYMLAPLVNIYDENGVFKGTAGYDLIKDPDGSYINDFFQKLYSDITPGETIGWDIDNIVIVADRGNIESAITNVCIQKNGEIEVLKSYPAVLSYNKNRTEPYYIGIQFEVGAVTYEQLRMIAESVDFYDNTIPT